MTPADLPQYARPWKDPLGNVWCVTLLPGSMAVAVWCRSEDGWGDFGRCFPYDANPDLLAGLGRACPPVPTPKREAKAVRVEGTMLREYAAKNTVLYTRHGDGNWFIAEGSNKREHVLAAADAFAGAGDYLPGEAPDA